MSRLALFNSIPHFGEDLLRRASLENWPFVRRATVAIAFLIAVAVFVFDCWSSASGALTTLYAVAIVITLGARRQEALVSVSIFCVLLLVLGCFVGQSNSTLAEEIVQRGTTLVAIGLVAWVGWQLVESSETIQQMRVDACLRQVAEEAATFFRSMVDHVPIGISRTNLDGRFVYVNEEFCGLFGTSPEGLLGKTSEDLWPEVTADRSGSINRRVLQAQQADERIEQHTIAGRELFMKVIRTPVKDEQGRVIGIQKIWLDVTELQEAKNRLERDAQNLERSNVDLQQFAYVASHDLQEPLRAVSSYCQLIDKNYSSQLDERATRWLKFVASGAQRMQTLVRDLLAYARVDNKSESWITVDSYSVCRLAVENLTPAIQDAGATVTVERLPIVWADATQLEALFQNLIGNAIKFRGERQPKVSVSAQKTGHEWKFAVQDNGIGIRPEFHDRVFEIFKRLDSQEQYSGTGIGLAICKRIVERYSGRIWVESQVGRGSTFYFTLPCP